MSVSYKNGGFDAETKVDLGVAVQGAGQGAGLLPPDQQGCHRVTYYEFKETFLISR